MTDVTLPKFNDLNTLRPADACFGEVVCIELYINGESRGYSKRKSIHVPPSSNAYWNFVGIRSLMVEYANELGIQRRQREALYHAIEMAVEWIHENELLAVYKMAGNSVQYYDLNVTHDGENVSAYVTDTNEDQLRPLYSVVVI